MAGVRISLGTEIVPFPGEDGASPCKACSPAGGPRLRMRLFLGPFRWEGALVLRPDILTVVAIRSWWSLSLTLGVRKYILVIESWGCQAVEWCITVEL